MGDVMFEPNLAGIREALKQGGVRAALGRQAASIAGELNAQAPGYGSSVSVHQTVAVGRVFTATSDAMENEARNHTMEPYCDRSYRG